MASRRNEGKSREGKEGLKERNRKKRKKKCKEEVGRWSMSEVEERMENRGIEKRGNMGKKGGRGHEVEDRGSKVGLKEKMEVEEKTEVIGAGAAARRRRKLKKG